MLSLECQVAAHPAELALELSNMPRFEESADVAQWQVADAQLASLAV